MGTSQQYELFNDYEGFVVTKEIFGVGYIITDEATEMLRLEREWRLATDTSGLFSTE